MNVVIIILIVGAFIQSFIHCTKGTIHAFDKLFGGFYSMVFIILTIFSIIKYGIKCLLIMPAVFYGSNLLFTIIFDELFGNRKEHRNQLRRDFEMIDIMAKRDAIKKVLKEALKTNILNLASQNYSYELIDGCYKYSNEITEILSVLNDDNIKNIYNENISNYNSKKQKELDKKDPLTFTIEECIIYLNWLWQLEETEKNSGIILKRIEDNRYLYTLKRLYDLFEEIKWN